MKRYGKNPSLLKVEYIRPNKKKETKECFQILYIDDDGNVKYSEEEALVPIYFVKPEYRTYEYNKPEELIDHMEKRMVLISKIKDEIVNESGEWGRAIRDKARSMQDFSYENQLFKWPYCYGCDFLPEFYFMHQWFEEYSLKMPKINSAFLDIETDILDYSPELDNLQNTAYAPINLVSVYNESTNEAIQFILRPYVPKRDGRSEEEYKQRYAMYERQFKAHQEMMNDIDAYVKELHDRFDEVYGNINYKIREYEKEIDLIADVFRFINSRKPHFCMIWNMRFDIQYFIERIKVLGYDTASIMCSPEIHNQKCYFKEDRTTFDIPKQFDFFHCSSFTQYICQMRLKYMSA